MENRKNLYKPVKIGKLEVPGNLFLAPLAGYTDRAFRRISREMGADFTYTEMISSEAVVRGNDKTLDLAEKAPNEEIYGIQIFSGSAESAAGSLEKLLPFNPSVIDLNCGCPVPKIIKSGAGSALMQNPEKIREIVRALTSLTDIPVTVKIRSGWTSDTINYLQAAEMALEGGASLISIHPRTRAQAYSGKSDWSCIKKLKEEFDVPVIGSGDLYSGEDARRMLEETGCDAVMFARGAIGNPFVFAESKAVLTGESRTAPTEEERVEAAFRHFDYAVAYIGEERAVKEMRKHLCAYTKGIQGGSAFRNRIVHGTSVREYKEMFDEFLGSLRL
ncbi:tRNA dihydrouridine synthase DusB [Spirochaeta isovalerica]|uniref:tRNA-dihydrouridine synthase n=1 Tax=Spirochaeta isovalerica TaxID=150 RepID=A0A841RDC1_9SPIO|nr:tRNA dihydrouridine synthase DusB [Spirochaeta isovalerica]MBB6480849.1 nifR3 family TIM-barrel protein [Spirochaeta isovalerica]